MPIRGRHPFAPQDPGLDDALESLRRGTMEQMESTWINIPAGAQASVPHSLGEVPRVVDVLQSQTSDGKSAMSASVTIVKTAESITITNTDSAPHYFQVRAF